MNDETASAKGKAAGKNAKAGDRTAAAAGKAGAAGGNVKVEGQIARMLVRAIWVQEWLLANPDAKPEDRQAAWTKAREAAIEKNLKPYRRALNGLARSGVTFGIAESADKADVEADEDDGGAA